MTGLERGERVDDTEEARGAEIQKGKGLVCDLVSLGSLIFDQRRNNI